MNKLVAIVGPTGTGKTKKAIELSKQEPSILVSADSRQVYRHMDIVTGKDHPKDITIHGIDIVDPDEPCSVAIWYDAVMPHIKQAWKEGKQVILVGGTGLYVKAITSGIATMQVPINQVLRDELSPLSIPELQAKLSSLDSLKLASMNHSDLLNPRRLIRAIEVAGHPEKSQIISCDSKLVGLKYSVESIERNKIQERVVTRLELGAITETKSLLSLYNPNLQSMSAIGYRSIIKFIEKSCTEDEMIEEWVSGELSYAKRQMTWFRKQPVIWYDVATRIWE